MALWSACDLRGACVCGGIDIAWHLRGEDLQSTLMRMSGTKACGLDGWRVLELKALPLPLLQILAEALQRVENEGVWPAALTRASICLIPKGSSDAAPAPQMRPITIMSIIYRMWASTRLRQLKVWQEAWCSPSQHGFRVGHGCEDVLWRFGLLIEDALVGGGEIFTVHYDFAKCFDSIPHEVTLRLAEELGMPKGICRAMSSMYKGLDRHFRVPGGMGEGFRATNGILQGCPISVVLVNVLLVVWLRDLGSLNIEGLAVGLYADDVSAKTSTIRDIARISSSLCEFCSRTGLRINAKKSCWCTCPHRPEKVACSAEDLPLTWECNGVTLHESRGKRALLVDGEMIPQVGAATCLVQPEGRSGDCAGHGPPHRTGDRNRAATGASASDARPTGGGRGHVGAADRAVRRHCRGAEQPGPDVRHAAAATGSDGPTGGVATSWDGYAGSSFARVEYAGGRVSERGVRPAGGDDVVAGVARGSGGCDEQQVERRSRGWWMAGQQVGGVLPVEVDGAAGFEAVGGVDRGHRGGAP